MSDSNRYKTSAKNKTKEEKANKHINFVVIAYGLILGYLVILIYISFTKDDLNFVYAEPGYIYNEGNFSGLILKDESIVYSSDEGPVKYFVPEGSKVRQSSYVCAVNQDAETEARIEEQINLHLSQLNNVTKRSADDYNIMQNKIRDYALDKHNHDTNLVYDSKDILQGTILDISQTVYVEDQQLFDQIQKEIAANQSQREENGTYYSMPNAGVVGYTFDGFEQYNIENYDYSLLSKDIAITDAATISNVSNNDPLFKIINNQLLYILVEIDPYAHKILETNIDNGQHYKSLYFPRKNIEIAARIHELSYDNGSYYAIFEVDRYFDEFFTDRFVNFIIKYDDYSGIKIPNEAVTTKDLVKVPSSAIYEEEGSYKIQRNVYSDKDVSHKEVVPMNIKIYYIDDDYAYIDSMDNIQVLEKGDEVLYVLDESNRVSNTGEYILTDKITIEGVFILNKGYSDFKRIVTIYEDESFRIIDSGISYSVGLYDKVAADASEINEFTTVN